MLFPVSFVEGSGTSGPGPSPESGRGARVLAGALLGVVLLFSFGYGLGAYPLLDNNEGLYAEIPREMLATGDAVIPHLNGVPYVEKPPLLYYAVALSYSLFGVSATAARIPCAVAGAATCLLLLLLGVTTERPRTGWWAALFLAASPAFAALSRTVLFDGLLTAFLTASLVFFYLWYRNGVRRNLWIFWVALALGVMTKGLVPVVLAFGIVGLFLLPFRRSRTSWRGAVPPGSASWRDWPSPVCSSSSSSDRMPS